MSIGLFITVTIILATGMTCWAGETRDFIVCPEIHFLINPKASGPAKIDQDSLQKALQGAGYDVQEHFPPVGTISIQNKRAVLVIPSSSAGILTPEDISFVVARVKAGAVLITDTPTGLSRALGIETGSDQTRVYQVLSWCRGKQVLYWNDGPALSFVRPLPGSSVLYRTASGKSVSLVYRVGLGTVVFFSPYFDPLSGYGYSRFPDLIQILSQFGIVTPFSRQGVDVYFDAGYHYGENLEQLVDKWSAWGIRAVRVNVWNLHDQNRYFDYRALADAVHRKGMLIYGWAQWPYAGVGFWEKHPEWRQKNGYLKDAVLSFLYLMDFQIEACRKAVVGDVASLLETSEFDGFDLAEFSITGGVDEALEGPSNPANFVGFGNQARAEFRRMTGVDPIELLNPSSPHHYMRDPALLSRFYSYRRQVNRTLTESVMSALSSLNRRLDGRLDLVMTVIDSSHNPEYDELYATDIPFIIDQTRKYGFTLQVEDPTPEWAKPPDRYLSLGQNYKKVLNSRPFDIDINFEDNHPAGQIGFPAVIPVGTEIHWLWHSAKAAARNVCFYSEYHIKKTDWVLMPGVMASGAKVRRDGLGWIVETPRTVRVQVQEDWPAALDGHPWYCRDGRLVLIPAGRHRLTITSQHGATDPKGLYLLSTTGELKDYRASATGLEVQFECSQRSLSRFRGPVSTIMVDGNRVNPRREAGNLWLVFLPPGAHRVVVSSTLPSVRPGSREQ